MSVEREVVFAGRIFMVLLRGAFEGVGVVIELENGDASVLWSEHVSATDRISLDKMARAV